MVKIGLLKFSILITIGLEQVKDFLMKRPFIDLLPIINYQLKKKVIYQLFELARNRDLLKYNNSFIASPYLSFGVQDLCERLNPNYLLT